MPGSTTAAPLTAAPAVERRAVFERLLVTLTWFGLSLAGTLVTFVVGGFPGIFFVELRVLTHLLTVGVLAIAALAFVWRPRTFAVPRLLPAGAVLLAAFALSAIASPWPRFAWDATLGAAAALAVYLVAVNVMTSDSLRPRVRFTIAALTVAVGVLYLVDLGRLWIEFYGLTRAFSLPPLRPAYADLSLGTPNIPAAVVLLMGPLVVVWIAASRRWLAAVMAIVFVAVVYFSGSRGAWLGAAVAALVLASTALPWLRGAIRGGGRERLAILALGGAAALVAVVVGPRALERLTASGSAIRNAFWQDTIGMFLQRPLTGTGPGTWAFAHWGTRGEDRILDVVAHAHNLYLQLAGELGLVGLGAGLLLAVAVVRLLIDARRWLPRAEVAAVVAGLAAVLAQSTVDNFSDLPVIVTGAIVLLAWVDSAGPARRPFQAGANRLAPRLVPALGVAALVAAAVLTAFWDGAALRYAAGATAQDAGRWPEAVSAYAGAARADPGYPLYAGAEGIARVAGGDALGGARRLAEAAAATDDPYLWIQAALAYAEAGEESSARAALDNATAGGSVAFVLSLNAGRVAELLGDDETAVRHYATALQFDPLLAESTYWRDPDRPVPAEAQFEAAVRRASELPSMGTDVRGFAYFLWLAAGDLERAASYTGSDAAPLPVRAAAGDDDAYRQLAEQAAADPLSSTAISSLAREALRRGDPEAPRYLRWAFVLDPSLERFALRHVVVGGDSTETALFEEHDTILAEEVYLRTSPRFPMVPMALRMGLR